MDTTLEAIRERIRLFLMDVGGLIWSDDGLDEAVRLALKDLQQVSPVTLAISGLDGALVTVLEMGMDGVIVQGASAYALEMRNIDRADAFELNQTGVEMGSVIERIKKQYLIDVEKIRVKQFQASSGVPYFQIPDPDGL
jgi:thiazole synthase ThiGH ThiG subunit